MRLSHGGKLYVFTNAKVASVSRNGNVETITLNYESVKVSHDTAKSSIQNMKAQDYNSSRSNNTRAAKSNNHNTTRSNKTLE